MHLINSSELYIEHRTLASYSIGTDYWAIGTHQISIKSIISIISINSSISINSEANASELINQMFSNVMIVLSE